MMFAQLGEFVFEGLNSPNSINENHAVKYGRISLINGKDVLQFTGEELDEISLTINYHVDFCNPAEEIKALRAAKRNAEVLPFFMGDGSVVGKFVITNVDVKNNHYTELGQLTGAEVTVDLLEYAAGDEIQPRPRAVKPTAAQLDEIDKVPAVEEPIAPVPSPANSIASDVSQANSKVSGMKNTVAGVKKGTTTLKAATREVKTLANDAQRLYSSAKDKVEQTQKIIHRAARLPTSLDEAVSYADNLAKINDSTDLATLEKNVDRLSDSAVKVNSRMGPVISFSATREGGS